MPFIACLNNVTTTHATHTHTHHDATNDSQRTPDPPPNQRNGPADSTDHPPVRTQVRRPLEHYTLTTPPKHPVPDEPEQASRRAVKMLASTMQISNNNPTNPRHPQQTRSARRREEPEEPRPHTPTTSTPTSGGTDNPDVPADPSGPNSVSNHPPTNVRQMTRPRAEARAWQSTFH